MVKKRNGRRRKNVSDEDDIYRTYGLVMAQAQMAEALIGLLAANFTFFVSKVAGQNLDLHELFSETRRKTLGQLCTRFVKKVKEFCPETTLPEGLAPLLTELLETRNWLAHRYFPDRIPLLEDPEHRPLVIEELRLLSTHLSMAVETIRPVMEMVRTGLTRPGDPPFDGQWFVRQNLYKEYGNIRASIRRLRGRPPFGFFWPVQ